MLKETTHPLAFVEPCYTVDRECAFWSCDFAHLFAFQKKLKNAMSNSLIGGMGGG